MAPNKITHDGHICCLLIWYIIQNNTLLGLTCYLFTRLGCQFSPQLYCSSGAKLWWAHLALHGSSSSRHLGKNLTSVKVTLLRTRLLDKGDTSALETQLLSFLQKNTAASCDADRNLTNYCVMSETDLCLCYFEKRTRSALQWMLTQHP